MQHRSYPQDNAVMLIQHTTPRLIPCCFSHGCSQQLHQCCGKSDCRCRCPTKNICMHCVYSVRICLAKSKHHGSCGTAHESWAYTGGHYKQHGGTTDLWIATAAQAVVCLCRCRARLLRGETPCDLGSQRLLLLRLVQSRWLLLRVRLCDLEQTVVRGRPREHWSCADFPS